ncbi:transposase [Escherichia coli]|uniref:transposase n=1 Tax=Escherichia coli TaxID=562 RepID=UPI0032EFEAB0
MSVTCGGLNKHGQWKKLSFLKDAMRSRWMWNNAAAASESVVRGDGNAGVVVTYHDGITVGFGAEIRRKILAYVHVEETAGGRIRHATGRYLKKPPIAASRLAHYNGGASLSFRYRTTKREKRRRKRRHSVSWSRG